MLSFSVYAITVDRSFYHLCYMDFLGGSVVKNLPANARDTGSILGSGRSPGKGSGNTLWYCLVFVI